MVTGESSKSSPFSTLWALLSTRAISDVTERSRAASVRLVPRGEIEEAAAAAAEAEAAAGGSSLDRFLAVSSCLGLRGVGACALSSTRRSACSFSCALIILAVCFFRPGISGSPIATRVSSSLIALSNSSMRTSHQFISAGVYAQAPTFGGPALRAS